MSVVTDADAVDTVRDPVINSRFHWDPSALITNLIQPMFVVVSTPFTAYLIDLVFMQALANRTTDRKTAGRAMRP